MNANPQEDSAPRKKALQQNIGMFLCVIGVGVVFLSVKWWGKEWVARDFVYEVGFAIVVLGFVETLLKGKLEEVASKQTTIERVYAEWRQFDIEMKAKWEQRDREEDRHTLERVEANIGFLKGDLDRINDKLDDIHAKVDPDFAHVLELIRSAKTSNPTASTPLSLKSSQGV